MSQTIQTLHDLVTPKALEATQDLLGTESAKTDALTALYALMAARLTHADTVERTESLTEEQLQNGDTLLDSLLYDGVTTVALPASVYGAIAGRLSLPVTTVAKLSEAALPDAYGYIKIIADDKPVNAHLAQESLELLNTIPAWLAALLPTGLLTITKDEILAAQSTQEANTTQETDIQNLDSQLDSQADAQDDNTQANHPTDDVVATQEDVVQDKAENADTAQSESETSDSQADGQDANQDDTHQADGVSSLGVVAGVATAGVLGALAHADEVQEETTQEAAQDITEETAQDDTTQKEVQEEVAQDDAQETHESSDEVAQETVQEQEKPTQQEATQVEITQEQTKQATQELEDTQDDIQEQVQADIQAQVQDEIGGELETIVSEQQEIQTSLDETLAQETLPQHDEPQDSQDVENVDVQNVDAQIDDVQNDNGENNDVQATQEQTDEPVADKTAANDEQETAQQENTQLDTANKPAEAFAGIALGAVAAAAAMLHSKLPDTANFGDKQSDMTATDNEPVADVAGDVADESADNQAEQVQEIQEVASDLDNKEQVTQNEQTDESDAQDQNTLEQETDIQEADIQEASTQEINTQETNAQEADTQKEQEGSILPRAGLATGVVASALAAMHYNKTSDNQAKEDTQQALDDVNPSEKLAQESLDNQEANEQKTNEQATSEQEANKDVANEVASQEVGNQEAANPEIDNQESASQKTDEQEGEEVSDKVATSELASDTVNTDEANTDEASTVKNVTDANLAVTDNADSQAAAQGASDGSQAGVKTQADTKDDIKEETKDDTKAATVAAVSAVAATAAVATKSAATEPKAQPATTQPTTQSQKVQSATTQPVSSSNASVQPNNANTTQATDKKESNFFKSLLPIIGLLVIGAVVAMLVKNQQKEPTPIAKPQPSTEQISSVNPASFALALNNTGDKIYACSADVGNPILGEQIRAAVSSLFDANDCRFNVNSAINKDMPIAMYVPQILGFMKGVPDASIRVSDKQVTLNSSSPEALQTLVSNITIALPDDFKIVAEPNLDSSLEVAESIEMSKKALDELGDEATSDDIAHALNQQIINFDENSSQIPEANKAVLDKAATHLKANPDARLTITGHTDDQGTPEQKQQLSTKRAEAVRDYLVKQGVNTEKLSVKGSGAKQPVASNATEKGRFQNSRIEFTTEQPTTQTLVDNSTRTVKGDTATKATSGQKTTPSASFDETTNQTATDTISASDVNIIQEPSDKVGGKSGDKSSDEPTLATAPTAKPTKDSKPSAQLIQTEPNGATCPPCNCTCGGE